MKKTTLKKVILIALAIILFTGIITSNVFAAVPVQITTPDTASSSTYTVTFNTNGGSLVAIQSIASGNKATRPETDPTREGYTFDDWYADASFTTKFNFDEAITANTTVYAKWVSSASVTPTAVVTPTTTTNTTDSSIPQTGDASDYAIFALIGLCGVVSVVAFLKAKKYNLK